MKLQTEGRQTERNTWLDHLGFEGPLQPGTHARSDPTGEFPTGPAVGEQLPTSSRPTSAGRGSTSTRPAVVGRWWWPSTARQCGDRLVARSWSSCNPEWSGSKRPE